LSKFLRISSKSPKAPEPGAAAPAKPEYTLPLASIAANKPSVPLTLVAKAALAGPPKS